MKADDTKIIFDALRRIVRGLRQSTDREGALGPTRIFIMQLIAEHGSLGVGELALRTHTSPPSVSVVAKNLVAAGFLVRESDPSDGRRHLLALTDLGRDALSEAPPAVQHKIDEAISALSAPDRRALARLLARIAPGRPAPLFFEDRE